MGAITKAYTFVDDTVGEASEVNANFDPVYATLNCAVNSQNLAPSGVTTSRFALSAVTSDKIKSSAVTTVKMVDDVITVPKKQITVTAFSGADPSLGGLGYSVNNGVDNVTHTGTAAYDFCGTMSTTLTTRGGPVELILVPQLSPTSPTNTHSFMTVNLAVSTASFTNFKFNFLRNASNIASYVVGGRVRNLEPTTQPPSFTYIDHPSAGTHTYKAQGQNRDLSGQTNLLRHYLVAREIK